MTDDLATAPHPDLPQDDGLVRRGTDGDPLPTGTRMTERESYERVIEGLKIMADAAAHLSFHEDENREKWLGVMLRLDMCRRIAVQKAGIEDPIRQKETERVRRNPIPWRDARDRFRGGGKQAAGGMRQLATCFRIDFTWTQMATLVEGMAKSVTMRAANTTRTKLILPNGYH